MRALAVPHVANGLLLRPSGRIRRMRFALDLQDSEIRDVTRDGSLVRLRLAAAAVRDEAGQRGWLSTVTLQITAADVHGDTTHAFGKISRAKVRHGSRGFAPLEVPDAMTRDIELTLGLANGAQLAIFGDALAVTVAGDAVFTADLSC